MLFAYSVHSRSANTGHSLPTCQASHGLLNIADHPGGAEILLTANATNGEFLTTFLAHVSWEDGPQATVSVSEVLTSLSGFAQLLRTPLVPLVLLGLQYVELVLRTGGQAVGVFVCVFVSVCVLPVVGDSQSPFCDAPMRTECARPGMQ
jgi:hypothetical protein